MIPLLIGAGWCVLAVPVAVLIGRGLRAMDPGEDPAPTPAPADAPRPVDLLGQREIDALFLRLVAPLDRELR